MYSKTLMSTLLLANDDVLACCVDVLAGQVCVWVPRPRQQRVTSTPGAAGGPHQLLMDMFL